MSTTHPRDRLSRMLGYGGLLLAIAGAAAIVLLGGNAVIAAGILSALLAAGVLAALPAMRDGPRIWMVTALWTTAIGVISIFSVGVIFLIATVFLLAAFARASW